MWNLACYWELFAKIFATTLLITFNGRHWYHAYSHQMLHVCDMQYDVQWHSGLAINIDLMNEWMNEW